MVLWVPVPAGLLYQAQWVPGWVRWLHLNSGLTLAAGRDMETLLRGRLLLWGTEACAVSPRGWATSADSELSLGSQILHGHPPRVPSTCQDLRLSHRPEPWDHRPQAPPPRAPAGRVAHASSSIFERLLTAVRCHGLLSGLQAAGAAFSLHWPRSGAPRPPPPPFPTPKSAPWPAPSPTQLVTAYQRGHAFPFASARAPPPPGNE